MQGRLASSCARLSLGLSPGAHMLPAPHARRPSLAPARLLRRAAPLAPPGASAGASPSPRAPLAALSPAPHPPPSASAASSSSSSAHTRCGGRVRRLLPSRRTRAASPSSTVNWLYPAA